MYSNPSTDHINIINLQVGTSHLRIYNATGELMKSELLQPGINTVDINSLSTGVHFCDMDAEKVKLIKK
ncbi:MAG TPA: T9SS type A sorting domain-containing protein [Arachidicoccus sp.]|nr:T9SS type A sorting domain-containing protein [Arachidicoccus sp.]